jgi:hypothetical protein
MTMNKHIWPTSNLQKQYDDYFYNKKSRKETEAERLNNRSKFQSDLSHKFMLLYEKIFKT